MTDTAGDLKRGFVSVVLPVYNGERYLREAIDSILAQTYRDFELIIINDGSRDRSEEITLSYADPRIRYFSQENSGLTFSLNRGISLATGEFIARMDADDVSFPERFARQIDLLNERTDVALAGTWAEIWVETEKTRRVHRHPSSDPTLKTLLLFDNPFVHSSVMFRVDRVREIGGYTIGRTGSFVEDYDLWSRLSRRWKVANIPEVLHVYRERAGSITDRLSYGFVDSVVEISAGNIERLLGQEQERRVIREVVRMYHKAPGRYETGLGETLRLAASILSTAWRTYGFEIRGLHWYLRLFAGIIKNYIRDHVARRNEDTPHG